MIGEAANSADEAIKLPSRVGLKGKRPSIAKRT